MIILWNLSIFFNLIIWIIKIEQEVVKANELALGILNCKFSIFVII